MAIEFRPLAQQETVSSGGYTHYCKVTYADLVASGTGTTLSVAITGALGVGMKLDAILCYLRQSFTGGAISAMTVSIGDSNSTTNVTAANSVLLGNTPIVSWSSGIGSSGLVPITWPAGNTGLVAAFTSTSANLNVATAGQLEIFLKLIDPVKLSSAVVGNT